MLFAQIVNISSTSWRRWSEDELQTLTFSGYERDLFPLHFDWQWLLFALSWRSSPAEGDVDVRPPPTQPPHSVRNMPPKIRFLISNYYNCSHYSSDGVMKQFLLLLFLIVMFLLDQMCGLLLWFFTLAAAAEVFKLFFFFLRQISFSYTVILHK